MKEKLLEIRNLKKYFYISKTKSYVKAVDNVNLTIYKNEIFGLAGETGCGKSTLSKLIFHLIEKDEGEIFFQDEKIDEYNIKKFRFKASLVFQDPFKSLNPRHTIKYIIEEPLIIQGIKDKEERREKVIRALERVGLSEDILNRYPHEFSGGQRQRIAIARAIITNPVFLIADEAVSALDVSIQAQILNLLLELNQKLNITILFISHDLYVLKAICDRIGIMYKGKIVEVNTTEKIYNFPEHQYTKKLIECIK